MEAEERALAIDKPRLLSTSQAAEHLGLSAAYLTKKRITGGGPAFVKLGTRVSYDPADLDAWVEANKRRSTSDQRGRA